LSGAHKGSNRVDAAGEVVTIATSGALVEVLETLGTSETGAGAVAKIGSRADTAVHAAVFAVRYTSSLSIARVSGGACGTSVRTFGVGALRLRVAGGEVFHETFITVQLALGAHPTRARTVAHSSTDTWCVMLTQSSRCIADGELAIWTEPSWGSIAITYTGGHASAKVLAARVTDGGATVDTSVALFTDTVVGRLACTLSRDTSSLADECLAPVTFVASVTCASLWRSADTITRANVTLKERADGGLAGLSRKSSS